MQLLGAVCGFGTTLGFISDEHAPECRGANHVAEALQLSLIKAGCFEVGIPQGTGTHSPQKQSIKQTRHCALSFLLCGTLTHKRDGMVNEKFWLHWGVHKTDHLNSYLLPQGTSLFSLLHFSIAVSPADTLAWVHLFCVLPLLFPVQCKSQRMGNLTDVFSIVCLGLAQCLAQGRPLSIVVE